MSCGRARLLMLNELMSFPSIRGTDWTSQFCEVKARIGDLVSLSSAPVSKWYLSWLIEIEVSKYDTRYLLQSIEDGELCWWGNVGLSFYDRKKLAESPRWLWDDKQFQFSDRWFKVCKKHDPYFVRPMLPMFNGDEVELSTRVRWEQGTFWEHAKFSNWKKTTMKMMEEYYLQCCAEYKERNSR